MADGKVLLEVVVEGKNVKVVQRQVEGVTSAVNDNTNAQRKNAKATQQSTDVNDHFNRGLKGVGQSSLSSGKALSKQRDLIGSSSFVGAYATLAANLFAASAAFNAFKSAADVQKVIKSIEILGTTSGTNIVRIGENIQKITGYGLSMGESMKAASLGVSAGLDATQLETLAKVAKGASAALGRDLGDSYDRLIRGVAKLEPEILDELGILVKIDKATTDYAVTVGKAKDELSQWERVQAFANATATQGIAKFGLLADAVETSPYDKLSASLDNLAKSTITWLSETAKIPEFFNYISENVAALTGTIALFVSTIARQMLPILYEGPQKAAEAAKGASLLAKVALEEAKDASKNLGQSVKSLPAGYKNLIPAIQSGTASIEDQKKATTSLTKSIAYYDRALANSGKEGKKTLSPEKIQTYTARQAELTAELKRFQDVQKGVSSTQIDGAKKAATANALQAKSNVLLNASSGSGILAIKGLGTAFSMYKVEALAGTVASGGFSKAMATLKAGTFTAMLGVRALGAAFLSILPFIGLFVTFGPMIYDWFKNKFFPESEVDKKEKIIEGLFSKITDLTTFLSKTDLQYQINIQDPNFDASIEGLKLIAASFREIRTSIISLLDEIAQSSSKIAREVFIAPAEARSMAAAKALREKQAERRAAQTAFNSALASPSAAVPAEGRKGAVAEGKNITDAWLALQRLDTELQTAMTEVSNATANRLNAMGDAAFSSITTAMQAELSLIPEIISSATKEVEGMAIVKKASDEIKKSVVDDVTTKFKAAQDSYTKAITELQTKATVPGLDPAAMKAIETAYRVAGTTFRNSMSDATGGVEQFLGAAEGMPDQVASIVKALSESAGTITTPFDEALKAVRGLTSGIKVSGVQGELLNKELQRLFNVKYAKNINADLGTLEAGLTRGANATRALSVEKSKLQNLESLSSGLQGIAGIDLAIQEQRVKVFNTELTIKREQYNLAVASNSSEERKTELLREIEDINNKIVDTTNLEISAKQKVLGETTKIFQAQKQIFELGVQTAKNKLILSKPEGVLSLKEEDRLVKEQYSAKLDFAQKEYALKIQSIDLEYKLLNAQYALFREQAKKEGVSRGTLTIIEEAMSQLGQSQASAIGVAAAELENLTSNLDVELQKAGINLASKIEVSVGSVMKNIGDMFYEDIKNTVPLVQQLASSFASAVDAASESFVDAIVEGKNIFKSIGDALRNSLKDTLAEAAKSQIKLGLKLMLRGIPGLDKLLPQDPAQQAATAATSVASSATSIATTLSEIPGALASLSCTCGGTAANQGPYVPTPGKITDTRGNPIVGLSKKDNNLLSGTSDASKVSAEETQKGNWLTDSWGRIQESATNNVAAITATGFASMAAALAAGASPKKALLGGVLGAVGSAVGFAYGGPAGAAAGGQIGTALGSSFAKGGVMTSSGSMPLKKYARGGIAKSPQLAMFGEGSRPEAYVPLPDGKSIPVTMSSGGGNVNNISVNVAVDGNGTPATSTSQDNSADYSRKLGVAISNAVKTEISNQQRPGGLLYKGRR